MWAIAVKEFRQMVRDRRTLALMIAMPLVLLVVFGYAASFDVTTVSAEVVGPRAEAVAAGLPEALSVDAVRPSAGRGEAIADLRAARYHVVVVTEADSPASSTVLVDGSSLFTARAVVSAVAIAQLPVEVEVLFNPGLRTSVVMVPGLIGIVLVLVGTLATALGVVRERQAGTLEGLAVMPFRPRDVILGKLAPYFAVAVLDTVVVVVSGLILFGVPFEGSVSVFALASALFLFATLGIGVLISTVSENQGQAMQVTMLTVVPQILLSGLLFPLSSMAPGVRWIAYFLPLTYYIDIVRGVMVRGAPIGSLWFPLTMLAVLGGAVFALSITRFRRDLAPTPSVVASDDGRQGDR